MRRQAMAEQQGGNTVRVVMTKTMRGSEDGLRVKLFESGQEYDMERSLAESFLAQKAAKPAPKPKDETKSDPKDTKGGKGPDENK